MTIKILKINVKKIKEGKLWCWCLGSRQFLMNEITFWNAVDTKTSCPLLIVPSK
jgi:hypothetical protein